ARPRRSATPAARARPSALPRALRTERAIPVAGSRRTRASGPLAASRRASARARAGCAPGPCAGAASASATSSATALARRMPRPIGVSSAARSLARASGRPWVVLRRAEGNPGDLARAAGSGLLGTGPTTEADQLLVQLEPRAVVAVDA